MKKPCKKNNQWLMGNLKQNHKQSISNFSHRHKDTGPTSKKYSKLAKKETNEKDLGFNEGLLLFIWRF
jgi:hypothetical protein